MSERLIACANCGARYKLPDSVQAEKVRCKKCGGTIEIATSLVSAETAKAPPTPAPAAPAHKPAAAAGTEAPAARAHGRAAHGRAARGGRAGRAGHRTAGRRGAEEADTGDEPTTSRAHGRAAHGRGGRGGRGARGHRGEAEPKSRTPLYIGIGASVIAVVVVVFLLTRGGDTPQPGPQGGQPVAAGQPGAGNAAVAKPEAAEPTAKEPDQKPDAEPATGKPEEGKPEVGKPEAVKPEPATAKKPTEKKPAEDDPGTPFDAKSVEPLAWAPDTSEEEKTEISKLAKEALEEPGIRGQRATTELTKTGRKAFPAIVNALREVDYMDGDEAMTAFMLHKAIEDMLLGRNVGFKPPNPGEPIPQKDAWWNAKCLQPLQRFWADQVGGGDKAAWEDWMRRRRENLQKEGEGSEGK